MKKREERLLRQYKVTVNIYMLLLQTTLESPKSGIGHDYKHLCIYGCDIYSQATVGSELPIIEQNILKQS